MTEIRRSEEVRTRRSDKTANTRKDVKTENNTQNNNSAVQNKSKSADNNLTVTQAFNKLDNVVSQPANEAMNEINGVKFKTSNQTNPFATDTQPPPGGPNVPPVPDRVSKVMDVDAFLDNVQVPAEIQKLGADEVNKYKIYALGNELHSKIYEDTEADKQNNLDSYMKLKLDPANNNPDTLDSPTNGKYRDNPPFDDVDAEQTLMIASAKLSYEQVKDSGLQEGSDKFNREWKNKFVNYQSDGINNFNSPVKFGDYGWNKGYQDGTAGQANHFWAGASMTYNAFKDVNNGWNPLYSLGIKTSLGKKLAIDKALEMAYQHELDDKPKGVGGGSSQQDMLNSALAVKLGFVLYDDKNFSPYDFANCWAGMTRSDPAASLDGSSFTPKKEWMDNLYTAPVIEYPPALE